MEHHASLIGGLFRPQIRVCLCVFVWNQIFWSSEALRKHWHHPVHSPLANIFNWPASFTWTHPSVCTISPIRSVVVSLHWSWLLHTLLSFIGKPVSPLPGCTSLRCACFCFVYQWVWAGHTMESDSSNGVLTQKISDLKTIIWISHRCDTHLSARHGPGGWSEPSCLWPGMSSFLWVGSARISPSVSEMHSLRVMDERYGMASCQTLPSWFLSSLSRWDPFQPAPGQVSPLDKAKKTAPIHGDVNFHRSVLLSSAAFSYFSCVITWRDSADTQLVAGSGFSSE